MSEFTVFYVPICVMYINPGHYRTEILILTGLNSPVPTSAWLRPVNRAFAAFDPPAPSLSLTMSSLQRFRSLESPQKSNARDDAEASSQASDPRPNWFYRAQGLYIGEFLGNMKEAYNEVAEIMAGDGKAKKSKCVNSVRQHQKADTVLYISRLQNRMSERKF